MEPTDEPNPKAESCCSGSCETPATKTDNAVLNAQAEGNIQTTLRVAGMDCGEEVTAVKRALKPLPDIREVRVNLMAGKVTVWHGGSVSSKRLIEAIGTEGLKASEEKKDAGNQGSGQRERLLTVAISAGLAGLGLALEWADVGWPHLRIALFASAIIAGGWFIFPKALRAARRLSPDMNLLMTVAVIGAALIGEWSEAAAVTFLFGLSEYLEAASLARARRAIQSLMELSPAVALLRRGDTFLEVLVEEVSVGDIVAVKSSQRVPLDGEVTNGASSVNQAPITGESMPVEKTLGDTVFAGTINGEGSLEVRVTKGYADTTLARIIHLVEEAQSQKASSQRFVDVFARYYTPVVMALALVICVIPPLLLGGTWGVWFYRALVLLVIACPCALVISTPVSIVSGLAAMARRGVLIKGGAFLETVGKLRALAVDKTGTITEGHPSVRQVIAIGSDESEILRVAAAIDTHSEHPLAKAIAAHAVRSGIRFPRSEQYQARTGRGAEGRLDGATYFVGNHRFAHDLGVCTPEIERTLGEIEQQGQSVVVVGRKSEGTTPGGVLGILAVGDSIRPGAAAALKALHAAGITQVVMLSGDNQRTADAIARQAGIDQAHGDLLPDDKIARVRDLVTQYRYVGMIGDGVNDAPAMAAASVGIAMGGIGTDTAIETADMVLMQDDLAQVAEAVHLGRRTVRVIQFNIAFALALKAVFLLLAVVGYTSLWLAIAADMGATLLVVANALRLLRPTTAT